MQKRERLAGKKYSLAFFKLVMNSAMTFSFMESTSRTEGKRVSGSQWKKEW